MDFFKRFSRAPQEPEDLDAGYDHDYYGGTYERTEEPEVAPRTEGPARRPEGYEGERRAAPTYRGGWEEEDARVYRERPVEHTEPVFEPEPAPEYLYFKPATYRDCREGIVRGLAAGHAVVVRLGGLESGDVLRLFDYMMGAVMALDGELVRPKGTTVVLLPHGVELDEKALELDDEEDLDEDEEYEDDEDYEDEDYDGEYDEEYDDEDYEDYDDEEEESDADAE